MGEVRSTRPEGRGPEVTDSPLTVTGSSSGSSGVSLLTSLAVTSSLAVTAPSPSPAGPVVPGPAAPVSSPTVAEPPFTVLRELGRGAGSVVHLGVRDDREYALKRQRTDLARGLSRADADRTLRREAALLASVNHPGLTRVHAVTQVEGRTAMVMDAHDGTSLADLLHAPPAGSAGPDVPAGVLSLTTTLRLLVDVCDALHALHRSGLVHRDVKPANVLVTRTGRAVLVDLGVAHLSTPVLGPASARPDGAERRREEAAAGGGSTSDSEVGALLYRAPEQLGVVRSPVDHRCDLWAVGALLLECLTGSTPVRATDADQVRRRLARWRPADLPPLGPGVPPAVGLLLRRLLALDPQERPAEAGAVADELSRIAADSAPDIALGRRGWSSPTDGPLLERGPQAAALENAWENARGGAGGVVVVRGAAGSGRTALVDRLRRRAQAQGALTVVLDSTTSPGAPLSALRRAMTAGGLTPAQPTEAPSVVAPGAATLEDGPDPRPQALAEELLQQAARTGPVLVVLDDTEHADASTLAVLRWVAGECADLPLLLVLVGRGWDRPGTGQDGPDGRAASPHPDDLAGADLAQALVVDVPPLSDAAARAVLRRRLPGAVVNDAVATALVSRAAGNPGALLALLTTLLDDGGLLPDWGQWRLEHAALEAVPVAPGLLAALLRRLAELPAGQRNVLRLAAACGRSVDDDLLVRAAGAQLDAATVHAGLAAGVAARLLRALPEGRHEFGHQQVVDAVLEEVDEVERRTLHARLARVLRADTRAGVDCTDRDALFACAHQHLRAGDAVAPSAVVGACAVAGVEAARQYAPESAVALLGDAVRIADDNDLALDPRLRRLLAACLARSAHHRRAHAQLDLLLATSLDPVERAVVHGEAATTHRHERAPEGPHLSAEAARRGLAELGAPRPRALAGWLAYAVAACALVLRTLLGPGARRASRHRLDSPREVERATVEGAHAVLLREAAAADLEFGHALRAVPTAVAAIGHALRARRDDLVRDGRWTLAAALRQAVTGRLTLLPVRLPGTASLVGRPLTAPSRRTDEIEPTVLAGLRLARGLHRLQRGGTWRDVADVLEGDGQWLDLPAYAVGTRAVALERLTAGHVATAASWHARAVRRVPEGVAVPAALDLVRVAVLGAKGRPGEAGDLLESLRRRPSGVQARRGTAGDEPHGDEPRGGSPLHRWAVELGTAIWLAQQFDLTERFDRAARVSTRLAQAARGPRLRAVPEIGATATLVVHGRLAQVREAAEVGDATRVRDLERLLRLDLRALRRARRRPWRAGSSLAAATADVVRAAALHRLGAARRAGLLLRRADARASRLDAPLLGHQVLLLRAERLAESGAQADAERLRWMATALAEKHGWVTLVHRQRHDVSPRPSAAAPASATSPTTTSAGAAGSRSATAAERGQWTPTPGRRRRLLSAMRDVGNAAQVLDPHDVVRLALDQACEVLGADRAALAVLDAEDELVHFAGRTRAGTDLPTNSVADPAAVRAARTGRPVVRGALDGAAGHDGGTRGEPRGQHREVARSVVAVPLLVRGRRTGVLSAASTVAQGAFGRGDVELLQLIAGQVAASLETARAARLEIEVHGAQRERDLAEAVRRVTEQVSGSLDLPTVRRRLLRSALAELGGLRAALVPVAVRSTVDSDPPALVTSVADATVREVAWSRDWQAEPQCAQLLERSQALPGSGPLPARLQGLLDLVAQPGDGPRDDPGADPVPWLVVPLRDRTGLVAEALVLAGGEDSGTRVHVAEALAAPAAIGLENSRLFAQVEHLARTDSLTGVATRGHLLRLGEQRIRRAALGRAVAVIMVDVDHFKSVNDTYGHAAGDEVLTAVARRLQHETRESDVLGRYGGEEFALVVTSPGPEEGHGPLDARDVAERLREGVRRTPVEVRGEQLLVTVSVGVALLRAGEQLSDVLARADTALYRAKAAGRDVVVVAP